MIIQLFIEPIYYFLAKFDAITFGHLIQRMDGVRDSSPHEPRLSSVFFPAIQQVNQCLFFNYFIIISQWGSTYIANVNKLVEINLPIEMRFPMHCFLSPVTNSTSGMVEPGLISFEDDKTTNHSILAYQYSGATRFARYLIIGN